MIITGTRVRGGKYYGGTASAVTTDTYFNLVTLLLPGNGTNGAQNNTFLDSSTNAFTVTRNGNTTQGTFSPFSQTGWSNYFDGTGDYLSTGLNAAFDFGSGAFTIEGWVNISSFPAGGATTYGLTTVYATGDSDVGSDVRVLISKGSTLGGYSDGVIFASNSTVIAQSGSFTFNANQWYHIAVTRSSNSIYIFIDGVLKSTTSYSSTLPTATTYGPSIGATLYRGSSLYLMTGYISNLRVLKGTAQYTATFTPPTSPLTNITNTSLLTCQSNRFVDNSSNAFAITPNGNTAVQAFAPFDPTTAYSAATVGGSGYFDGTGDYLALSNVSALQPGASTTPFCIECWAYPTAVPGVDTAVYGNFKVISYPGNCDGFDMLFNTAGKFVFRWGYPTYADSGQSAAAFINGWNHIVVARNSSGSLSCYLNGTRWLNTSSNTNITTPTAASMWVGWAGSLSGTTINPFIGYISGFRFTKGSTPYDPTQSTLTLPTAPPTAITDTQLLLNYTNGGITDAAAKNIFESINEAQISTAQSKFGGSSIAFDGNADYLTSPVSTLYEFGTGDFTVELWVRFNSTSGTVPMVNLGYGYNGTPLGAYNAWGVVIVNNVFYFSRYLTDGSSNDFTASWTPATNTWYHVAVSRQGTSLRAFIDGTQLGMTQTNSVNYVRVNSDPLYIGQYYAGNANRYLNGYIDDLRITKGYARYTANFTPPTQAFPTQ